MYQGSRKGTPAVLLRSYDSRREPPPEFDCKIWEAGRATCSIGLAFKPIRIGQSVFHDDGVGTFNPSPEALDEAVSEWPGREIGVFISVGTGKRPKSSDANSTMWYEGFMGEFAEARRRLIAKIEGCETIHEYMMREHLGKRGVNIENYYRLNVEIGVGEFGMNEWHRLAPISTGTKQYLRREREHQMVVGSASKLAKIHFANKRFEKPAAAAAAMQPGQQQPPPTCAIELPAEVPDSWPAPPRPSFDPGPDIVSVQRLEDASPRSSADLGRVSASRLSQYKDLPPPPPPRTPDSVPSVIEDDPDRFAYHAPTPSQYRLGSGSDKIAIVGQDDHPRVSVDGIQSSPRLPAKSPKLVPYRIEPPPLPPKTPLLDDHGRGWNTSAPALPYPIDEDEAPPMVNMARKPEYHGR